ncbi:MAG: hypothetical protein H0U57_00095 [Tatlockia sp.]|nr:hypothetical protein [Tatlockia sp.]
MHIYIDTPSLLDIYLYDLDDIERLKELIALNKQREVSIWFDDNAQQEFNNLSNSDNTVHENGWKNNYLIANSLIAELLLNSERFHHEGITDVQNFVIKASVPGKRVHVVSIDDINLTKDWNRENIGKVKFYPTLKRLLNSSTRFNS